jgi:hypothetical protein
VNWLTIIFRAEQEQQQTSSVLININRLITFTVFPPFSHTFHDFHVAFGLFLNPTITAFTISSVL